MWRSVWLVVLVAICVVDIDTNISMSDAVLLLSMLDGSNDEQWR